MIVRLQSFPLMLAGATQKEFVQQVQYLKEEKRTLRARSPRKLHITPQVRNRLLRFGKPLGKAIADLISIVSPRTFWRWLRAEQPQGAKEAQPRKSGRPRTEPELRYLILRTAEENAWGYTRIVGELRKLGIRNLCRSTVANILQENGYEPGPKRGPGTWSDFVHRHATTLGACDFFSKKVWTCLGLSEMFVFVVMHIGSRRVHVLGMTADPDAAWMAEQADQFVHFFEQQPEKPRYLIRDLDGKFTTEFDARLEGAGMEIVRVGPRAPNLNAHCERFIGSLKGECLSHFIVFGEAHLRHLISEYLVYYHTLRPHQGLDNKPLGCVATPEQSEQPPLGKEVCDERLGGLLRHYRRAA
jgi:putative transposase